MDIFSGSELKRLLEQVSGCVCVSIYMPAHRAGPEIRQDPIRLKNLLREAEARLIETGLRRPAALEVLEPAARLLDDGFFWRHQSDGLALFLAKGFFKYYRLPYKFDELVVVSYRFHIKPLLNILSNDGRFFVLALSQKQVRLLQCTHYGVSKLDLSRIILPSLDEFLEYDNLDRQYQYHYHISPPGLGGELLVAHGQEVAEMEKVNLLRYFQQIDKALDREILGTEKALLILAAVEYVISIYREANTYRNLIEEGIEGNPELLSPEELRDRAWALVQPYFDRTRLQAIARYQQLGGTQYASRELTKVVPESYYGRVEVLFVAGGVQQWGSFDPSSNAVALHDSPEPCDEDLLDLAAVHTLTQRGSAYVLRPEEMPGGSSLAAVFRY